MDADVFSAKVRCLGVSPTGERAMETSLEDRVRLDASCSRLPSFRECSDKIWKQANSPQ